MELLRNIAATIGAITTILSFIVVCSEHGRKIIHDLFSKNTVDLHQNDETHTKQLAEIVEKLSIITKRLNAVEEVSKQQCRNIIKDIYYKYYEHQQIPLYDRKTAEVTYDIYVNQFHGNSYVKILYDEICKWEIETISFHDELCE